MKRRMPYNQWQMWTWIAFYKFRSAFLPAKWTRMNMRQRIFLLPTSVRKVSKYLRQRRLTPFIGEPRPCFFPSSALVAMSVYLSAVKTQVRDLVITIICVLALMSRRDKISNPEASHNLENFMKPVAINWDNQQQRQRVIISYSNNCNYSCIIPLHEIVIIITK